MALGVKTLGLFAASTITPTTLGIGYSNSQEDFWEHVKDQCLNEEISAEENGDWKKIQDKLINTQNQEQNIFSEEFKNFKAQLKSPDRTGKGQRSLCISIYSQTYKSWFIQKDLLLKDLKNYCSLKIKEKLEKDKLFDTSGNTDQTQIKQKVTELQSHSDEKTNGNLDDTLRTLKASKDDQKDWETLRTWCGNIYEKSYLGKASDNDFTLAKKYCQKTQ